MDLHTSLWPTKAPQATVMTYYAEAVAICLLTGLEPSMVLCGLTFFPANAAFLHSQEKLTRQHTSLFGEHMECETSALKENRPGTSAHCASVSDH
jgi:hypothetical protein